MVVLAAPRQAAPLPRAHGAMLDRFGIVGFEDRVMPHGDRCLQRVSDHAVIREVIGNAVGLDGVLRVGRNDMEELRRTPCIRSSISA